MTHPTWHDMIANNPQHSQNYAARWRRLAAEGNDIDGEARLIDAMVARGAKILDAGCGTGRLGGYLAARGHEVVGVDLDPVLITIAVADHPNAVWLVGDLCARDWNQPEFDLIVCAGNVLVFLEIQGRGQALKNLASSLSAEGRLVVGFGAGRGWDFEEFLADASAAGLVEEQLWSTWTAQPFTQDSDFMVAVLRRH